MLDSQIRFQNENDALAATTARKRLAMLFDEGTYHEVDRFMKNDDTECEVVAAYGEVNGMSVYAFSQSIDINKGAMGKVQASKIQQLYDMAAKTGTPVVGFFDSNGAHVDEGIEALEAYGTLIKSAGNLSGVVPQISVVAGPCIGSAAVLATVADVLIVEKSAEFYVASPAFSDKNDDEIDTVYLAGKNGTASIVADSDKDAVDKVIELLSFLPSNNLSEPLFTEPVAPKGGDDALDMVIDNGSFLEINKLSNKSIRTGFARIGGAAVGIIKTESTKHEGYFSVLAARKAARFVRLCDAYSIPIITFVDSLGIDASESYRRAGDVRSLSVLTLAYSEATTPKITLVTGNAVSSAYIAFVSSAANPDMVFAWPEAVIGTMEPMTAVQLFYKDRLEAGEDRAELEKEYAKEQCSPFNAAAYGYVDDIFEPAATYEKINSALDLLASKRVSKMNKKHTNIPL